MNHAPHHLVVGVLAAAITSGCLWTARARVQPVDVYYSTSSEVYVSEPMPAPRVEVVTVAPAPGHYWVDGHWRWAGGGYAWVGGRWARPSRPGYVWLAPRYEARRQGHVYVHGRWAPPSARAQVVVRRGPGRAAQAPGRSPPARRGHSR